MSKYILSSRSDGLGVRLLAILNSIALSDILKCDFLFSWENNKSDNIYHDVESAELMFDGRFLADYCVKLEIIKTLKSVPLLELISSREEGIFYRCTQGTNDVKKASKKIANCLDKFDFKRIFINIGFSLKNKLAIIAADKINLPENIAALHLRSGDVVYGAFRCSGYYVNKVIPVPVAIDIIKKNPNIIIFSDDCELGFFLKKKYGVLLASDFCQADMDGVQRALFDIFLMSKCSTIIAGRSGFSMCAAKISGIQVVELNKIYGDEEIARIIYQGIDGELFDSDIPRLQVAHSIQALLTIQSDILSWINKLDLIERAEALDADNLLYTFLKIIHYLRNK